MENARKNRETGLKEGRRREWEEYDDDYEPDHDITVDLNEPHSRSGKYWKAYFENYHDDAKTEMEKLVKYKQLAKSYAKQKDAEAVDLNQKLKEEQEKVKVMEQRVSELARQVTSSAKKGGGDNDSKLMDDLAKQTALTLEYKEQVKSSRVCFSKAATRRMTRSICCPARLHHERTERCWRPNESCGAPGRS